MPINLTCPVGKIERVGYTYIKKTTNQQVNVKNTCIEDKGKPGKGPKLIPIPKEDIVLLSNYGYSLKDSYEKRIKILKKINKKEDNLKVLRHVNALRTLHKSNEIYYNKLNKDFKWLQEHYEKNK